MMAGCNRSLFFYVFVLVCLISAPSCNKTEEENEEDPDTEYFAQRNAYYGTLPGEVKAAIKQRIVTDLQQQNKWTREGSAPAWQLIGPANTGGRITDVAMPRGNDNIIYAASASGGIFKSTDFGISWTPVFDNEVTGSIGSIAIDPGNDNILYVGTGEPNTGGGSITYDGNGMYKSVDAGATWQQIGLNDVGTIGKVAVAATNSNTIYVAAVGNIFQKDTGKGLYKSVDAGASWNKILYISDSTSIIDVAVSPTNANTVFACAWERISRPTGRVYGGITSNLYKSNDGGVNWIKLLPDDANRGKMTIDIPPANANLLYLSVANKDGTFKTLYKYDGVTFNPINNGVYGSTAYMWWFGGITCHPTDDKIVYFSDFTLFRTVNGGTSWGSAAATSHVDQHAVFVHPVNTSKVVIGNDGGVYTSVNGLTNIAWCKIPNSQVYDFDLYKADETFVSAGLQDNNFAHTSTQNPDNWQLYGGGDGVQVRVDPIDKTETYSSQYLGLNITSFGIASSDRKNWKCPIRLDPVDPKVRYTGTNKVYKFSPATNRWTAISGDLTNGPVSTNPNYGTITALAVASSNNQYIYSGADDGSVYVTRNGGSNWTKITNGLPALWAMFIRTDSNNPEVAYIGFSGNRYGIEGALLYKTTDAGANWLLISNDLPQVPVNDLVIDAFDNHRLYIATDIGVFYSGNTGTNWIKLGTGMPAVVTTGLYYAPNSKMLYAATYGRSIYKTDLNSILPLNSIKLSLLKQSGNNILLQWQSSFIYMQGKFEAEQSTDAVHFTKIGEVMQEKDDVFINYKLNATPAGNHVIYYRIKFISADGKTNYSAVTVYKAAGNNSLKLYPNPVSNLLQVSLPLSLQHAIINVYNTNGAKMFTQKIAENILQTTLDVSRLPAGIYILECSGDNMLFKEKFVVTR